MKNPVLILMVLIALSGGIAVLWDVWRSMPTQQIAADDVDKDTVSSALQVPDAGIADIRGRSSRIHDFADKVVLINFWATWCAPCVTEFPDLIEYSALQGDDFVFIALSVDEDDTAIERFIQRLPEDIRQAVDLDHVWIARDVDKVISQDLFQTVSYPESYLIGPELRIHEKIIGPVDIDVLHKSVAEIKAAAAP